MKNLYIPKGETVHYETLFCPHIVNDGVLQVSGSICADTITGSGMIDANTVSARHISAMNVDCLSLMAETLTAERVTAVEVIVSGAATISCCLDAEYVEAPKLTVAKSKVGTLRATDVVNLPPKRYSVLGVLAAGYLRRLWLSLTCHTPKKARHASAADAARKPGNGKTTSGATADPSVATVLQMAEEKTPPDADLEDDFEFKRLKAMYRLLKDVGYTLRIVKAEEPPVSSSAEQVLPEQRQEAA